MDSRRNFARVEVRLRARFQRLDPQQAEQVRVDLACRPSVWSLSEEISLRNLADGASGGTEAVFAKALLELSGEIVSLRSRVFDEAGPMEVGVIGELSGGGGRLVTSDPLDFGTKLDLRLEESDEGAPPIRALVEVIHRAGGAADTFGFRFEAIHPRDQDRLIRFIYQLQRRSLREAHSTES